jgi:hypothetical protein
MRTIREPRTRRLALSLGVLGGSVLLAACGSSPVSPTAPAVELAAPGEDGGRASKSAGTTNFTFCRRCDPIIDPYRVPPNKELSFSLVLGNTGDAAAETVQVAVSLLGADGRRIPLGGAAPRAPRAGESVTLGLRVVVPAATAHGRYQIEAVLDPDNRIAESDETDNIWVSGESLAVVSH